MRSLPVPLKRLGALPSGVLLLASVLLFLFLRTSLPLLDATSTEATTIGLIVVAVLAFSAVLARRTVVSSVYGGQAVRRLLAALWSANLAFLAAATLRVWLDLGYPMVISIGVAVTAVGALAYWRTADIGPIQLSANAVQPLSSSQARTMKADARRAIARAGDRIDRRLVAQLNLARALMWLSMASDARAELAESRKLIEVVLQDRRANRRHLLDAAADLCSAVDSYARRTRDGRDYPVVLEILGDLAEGVPEAQAKLFECRAEYELFLGEMVLAMAQESGELIGLVAHYTDAVHYLTTAARLASNKDFRLVCQARAAATDAQLVAINPLGKLERLESAERTCEEAFSHFRRRDPGWMVTGVALAGCLAATARFQLDRGERGAACLRLSRAEQLCGRLLRRPADFEPLIRQLLVQILRMREDHCV